MSFRPGTPSDPRERLSWARDAIDEFTGAAIAHGLHGTGEQERERDHGLRAFQEPRVIPAKLRRLVSEALVHLRTSLDYAVYELSALRAEERSASSSSWQKASQFPIVDTSESFQNVGRRLRCLSEADISVVESFQPYRGMEWLGRLRDLSNADKHRALVFALSTGGLIASPSRVHFAFPYIALEDGSSAVEALDEMYWGVATVVDALSPAPPPARG